MQQEIFGPVLPVLTYESLGSAVAKINSMAHPLALYLFTSNEKASLEKEGGKGHEGQPFTPPRATPATMNLLRNR